MTHVATPILLGKSKTMLVDTNCYKRAETISEIAWGDFVVVKKN